MFITNFSKPSTSDRRRVAEPDSGASRASGGPNERLQQQLSMTEGSPEHLQPYAGLVDKIRRRFFFLRCLACRKRCGNGYTYTMHRCYR